MYCKSRTFGKYLLKEEKVCSISLSCWKYISLSKAGYVSVTQTDKATDATKMTTLSMQGFVFIAWLFHLSVKLLTFQGPLHTTFNLLSIAPYFKILYVCPGWIKRPVAKRNRNCVALLVVRSRWGDIHYPFSLGLSSSHSVSHLIKTGALTGGLQKD